MSPRIRGRKRRREGVSLRDGLHRREGKIFSPAIAKNILSVGSVYNSPAYRDIRAAFSCTGPTTDGRIKPDILAPGVNIESAGSSGRQEPSCGIAMKTGTSMSTPIVAATAALFSQYLEEGYYPSGEPWRPTDSSPLPPRSRQ